MKKIQDIKPPKKNSSTFYDYNKNESDFPGEKIYGLSSEAKNYEQFSDGSILKVKKSWKNASMFFLLLLATVVFFIGSLLATKGNIISKISKIEKNFPKLEQAISEKNFLLVAETISDTESEARGAILCLQSVGQNIYGLDLISPQGNISNTTKLANSVKAVNVITFSYSNLMNYEKNFNQTQTEKINTDWVDKTNQVIKSFGDSNPKLLKKIRYSLFLVKNSVRETDFDLVRFNDSEKAKIDKIKNLANVSCELLSYIEKMPANIDLALGKKEKKSYLILFQNNSEIRPSGGFLGSFARVDFLDGELVELDFEKNIYTLDKSYAASGKSPKPPIEYQGFIESWTMRDSNVYADFKESAKKISWFYKEQTGNDVDGVFAVDTTFFRDLLKITGPIEMKEYDMIITADNFLSDVQYQVEIGYFQDQNNWAENQPKKILSDMLPILMSRIISESDKKTLSDVVIRAIEEKHLLAFFVNGKLQDLVSGLDMSGEIKKVKGDYLYISDSNIGGKKSSLNIDITVSQSVKISEDGNVDGKISLLRKHNGSYNWPDGENKNFVKIFLPLSTSISSFQLSSDLGFSNDYLSSAEFQKKTVSFWQNTKPGKETTSVVDYRREKGFDLSGQDFVYQNFIQKQPGIEKFKYKFELEYPKGWVPVNVENYDHSNRIIRLNFESTKDISFSIMFNHSETK